MRARRGVGRGRPAGTLPGEDAKATRVTQAHGMQKDSTDGPACRQQCRHRQSRSAGTAGEEQEGRGGSDRHAHSTNRKQAAGGNVPVNRELNPGLDNLEGQDRGRWEGAPAGRGLWLIHVDAETNTVL